MTTPQPSKQKPATSLAAIIAITGLSTALAVGGYMHFSTVGDLRAEMRKLELDYADAKLPRSDSEALNLLHDSASDAPAEESAPAPENWIYGNPKARYTLVEMTDTECPYCRDHFPILKGIVESGAGHINAALLHVPAQGEASRQQAMGIECAGEQGGSEAAWKFAQLVFDKTATGGKGVAEPLVSLATSLSLNGKRFGLCMDSSAVIDRVVSDLEQAQEIGIRQTPSTIVIDNVTGQSMVLQGANANHDAILNAIATVSNQERAQ